jgi:hypothetical protein
MPAIQPRLTMKCLFPGRCATEVTCTDVNLPTSWRESHSTCSAVRVNVLPWHLECLKKQHDTLTSPTYSSQVPHPDQPQLLSSAPPRSVNLKCVCTAHPAHQQLRRIRHAWGPYAVKPLYPTHHQHAMHRILPAALGATAPALSCSHCGALSVAVRLCCKGSFVVQVCLQCVQHGRVLDTFMNPACVPCGCCGLADVLLASNLIRTVPDSGHIGLHACFLLLTKFPEYFWYALHVLVCIARTL